MRAALNCHPESRRFSVFREDVQILIAIALFITESTFVHGEYIQEDRSPAGGARADFKLRNKSCNMNKTTIPMSCGDVIVEPKWFIGV